MKKITIFCSLAYGFSMNQQYTVPDGMIERALSQHPTPFHIYDLKTFQANTRVLNESMSAADVSGYQNYFAVKALPNPHILRELVAMGHGLDCSSLAELTLAEQLGVSGEQIMFTSNNTSLAEFEKAHELGAIINFDDASYVDTYLEHVGVPHIACCRYNPGNLSVDSEEVQRIIGKPADAKYGMSRVAAIESYQKLKAVGVESFGLHAMLLSNNLSWSNHAEIARVLFELAVDISQEVGIELSFINLGGGIGVSYHPDDEKFDYQSFATDVKAQYEKSGLDAIGSPRIVMENGRSISGTAGWLVTKVQNLKQSYKKYVGVDASMADLMRPGMYGAYHHISLLGDEGTRLQQTVDVVGSLCENNDKFAIDRLLPELRIDDYIVIHCTGAHGQTMGFNYNGRLRSAELLNDEDGDIQLIRRAETLDDLFATIVPFANINVRENTT